LNPRRNMGAICSRRANRTSEESENDQGRKKPWPPSSPEDNNANGVLLVNKTSAVPVVRQSNNNKGEAMEKSRHEPADFHGSRTTVAHPNNNDFSFELAVISRHRDGNNKEEKKQPPSRKLSNKASAVRSMTTTAAKKSASKVRLILVYNSSHSSLNLISEEKMKTMMPSVDNKPTFSFGFIVAAVSGWCL
jgi:hypothetical protein